MDCLLIGAETLVIALHAVFISIPAKITVTRPAQGDRDKVQYV
jgi:hypothetical protein